MKRNKNSRQLYLVAEGSSDKNLPVLNEMKRPLSNKGVSDVLSLLENMKERHLLCPDLILCSAGLCPRQSLDLLYEVYPACDIVFKDSLYTELDYRIFDVVKVLDDILYKVMIITENTALTHFATYLLSGTNYKPPKFKPASCAILSLNPNISWHTLGKNSAILNDFF